MEFKENNKPIYLQLVDRLCDDILAQARRVGDRIPSVREMAAAVEINANTVMRTYEILQQNGIIYNKRGIGYFICDNAYEKVKKIRTDEFMNGELKNTFNQLYLLGISPDDLHKMYSEYFNNQK